MKIGIVSDTHDNLSNTIFCLEQLRSLGITTLIHCGDLTGPDLLSNFEGFKVIYTFGNCDKVTGLIKTGFKKLNHSSIAASSFDDRIDNRRVLVFHGNIEGQVMEAVRLRRYDYIFHGHTHLHSDHRQLKTRIINPGALGGVQRESRSYCVLDLETDDLVFHQVPE
jgi:putative phosphoesterase